MASFILLFLAFGCSISGIFVACGLFLGAFFFRAFSSRYIIVSGAFFFALFLHVILFFLALFSLKPDPSG